MTIEQIVAGFDEIAPRIDTEALPRIREDDFRRKVEVFVTRAQGARPTIDIAGEFRRAGGLRLKAHGRPRILKGLDGPTSNSPAISRL